MCSSQEGRDRRERDRKGERQEGRERERKGETEGRETGMESVAEGLDGDKKKDVFKILAKERQKAECEDFSRT